MAKSGELRAWAEGVAGDLDMIGKALGFLSDLWLKHGDSVRTAIDTIVGALGLYLTFATGGLFAVGAAIVAGGAIIDDYRTKIEALCNSASDAGSKLQGLLNKGQGIGAEPLHPGEKAPGGLTFTPPPKAGPITEEDKYAKLIEQLDVARNKAELLADAEGKGPAAIRDANIEIQTQTELLKLYNERTHQGVSEWSAQGIEIRQRIKEISDLTLAKNVAGETRSLDEQVAINWSSIKRRRKAPRPCAI